MPRQTSLVRRRILLHALAALPASRPAVSQHLKALKDAGLVKDRSEGTRGVYYIDPDGLGELRRWLDGFYWPKL